MKNHQWLRMCNVPHVEYAAQKKVNGTVLKKRSHLQSVRQFQMKAVKPRRECNRGTTDPLYDRMDVLSPAPEPYTAACPDAIMIEISHEMIANLN